MNKVLNAVLLSLCAPLIVGLVLGVFYAVQLGQMSLIFKVLLTALSNAHLCGLTMGFFVVPGYLVMFKYNMVRASGIITLGALGGALFSYLLSVQAGEGFLVNVIISTLASLLFLIGLRRNSVKVAN